jgi:hypothetical protein
MYTEQVPGTSRISQTPPISARASCAQLRSGMDLAGRPRNLDQRCHVRGTSPASVVASVYDMRA